VALTPRPIANRPGLNAIAYRAGEHGTFLETMKARLSGKEFPALAGLKTRDSSDPTIALLDTWATVADVLTFYQERIANEGYLRTAAERRSVLELARLIGYKPRPGVSASVYLAYTIDEKNGPAEIPEGTRAQSVPLPGETMQTFETSEKLHARVELNALKPRLTRPQFITPEFADVIDTLHLAGTETNLKVNDPLLFVFGSAPGQQFLRRIESVEAQAAENRTKVTLQVSLSDNTKITKSLQLILNRYLEASQCLPADELSRSAVDIARQPLQPSEDPASYVATILIRLQEKQLKANKAGNIRLAKWVGGLVADLKKLLGKISNQFIDSLPVDAALSTADNLVMLVKPLALPPSLQPANSRRLTRSGAQTYSLKSDIAPQVLTRIKLPGGVADSYQVWKNSASMPASAVQVYALRVTAQPFGSSAPKKVKKLEQGTGRITETEEWPLFDKSSSGPTSYRESSNVIYLDGSHDKILPDSWLVVDTSAVGVNRLKPAGQNILIAKAGNPRASLSRAEYGFSGKVTRVELRDPADLAGIKKWIDFSGLKQNDSNETPIDDDFQLIRRTVVYAQSESLALAEEPIWNDVCGDRIQLGSLVDGLVSGRWLIVSGERTDVPGVKGVKASELVMLSGLDQGVSPFCVQFPKGIIPFPFTSVFYITRANEAGDRLVVGKTPGVSFAAFLQRVPLPNAPKQMYCQSVELAPGLFADAYVPTVAERVGIFSDFDGLLIDPDSKASFPGGRIPINRLWDLFAWRIVARPLDSTIVLANQLAYTYKRDTVTIYANVVKATHGETRKEILGNGDGSKSLQAFTLKQPPLTYVSAPTVSGVASTLKVRVNDVEWHEVDWLAGVGLTDHSFITKTDDDAKTTVVFGNGKDGARLPTGIGNVTAEYRNGIGKGGNVRAEQISLATDKPLGVKEVINPIRASGGADKETRDQARRNAPLAVMALDRLVSLRDYADFTRTFAGVGKASARRLTDGHRQIAHITIAGVDDIPIDPTSDLRRNLLRALRDFGDPQLPVMVNARELLALVISAKVRVRADYQWEKVEMKIRAAMLDEFGFERRELGQTVFLSEVVSAIQRVPGVSYVDVDLLESISETEVTDAALLESKLSEIQDASAPRPFIRAEMARPGIAGIILPAQLAYLLPGVPDTLILNNLETVNI